MTAIDNTVLYNWNLQDSNLQHYHINHPLTPQKVTV